jgi:hypothetical protein
MVSRILSEHGEVFAEWLLMGNSKETAELRAFLVKLSGRQMRHKKEFTNPALLAGLWGDTDPTTVMRSALLP